MLNPCISYFGFIPKDVKCGKYWQCENCEYLEAKEKVIGYS